MSSFTVPWLKKSVSFFSCLTRPSLLDTIDHDWIVHVSSKAGFLKSAIEEDYHSALDVERERQKDLEEARAQRRLKEVELEDLRQSIRTLEATYRVHCTQLIEKAFQGLLEEERKEVLTTFEETLATRLFVTEFRKRGWEARAIFPDALRFWQSRGTPLPSFDQFAATQT